MRPSKPPERHLAVVPNGNGQRPPRGHQADQGYNVDTLAAWGCAGILVGVLLAWAVYLWLGAKLVRWLWP